MYQLASHSIYMMIPPQYQHLEEAYRKLWVTLISFDRPAFEQLATYLPLESVTDSVFNTVLHFAAAVGNSDSLCFVLNRPGNAPPINATNLDGQTALQVALTSMSERITPSCRDREVVRLLLEAGGDPSLPCRTKNALVSAAQVRCADTIYMLYCSMAQRQPSKRRLMVQLRHAQWTFQHFIWTRDLQLMRHLIEFDSKVLHCSRFNGSPLHQAIEARASVEFFDLLLREYGVNPNVTNRRNTNTPLHEACELAGEWDNADVVQKLLESGANPNIPNRKGRNCLHLAARAGSHPVVKLLIEHNVETDTWDWAGKNPMLYAAVGGSVQVLEALHNAGLSALDRCRTELGASTLHLASRYCHPEAVALLITKMGLNPNEKDYQNSTPLNYVVRKQDIDQERRCSDTIDVLVDCGADLFDESSGNSSALRYCLDHEFLHNASIIIRHLAIREPNDKSLNEYYMNFINQNDTLKQVYNSCLAEIESMKQFQVDGWVTLHEIVALPVKSIRPLMRNVDLKNKMNSWIIDHSISNKFPIYSSRIIGRYTFFEKEQKRMNYAKESLSQLIGFPDPRSEIIGQIVKYLNPQDIDNLFEYKLKEEAQS